MGRCRGHRGRAEERLTGPPPIQMSHTKPYIRKKAVLIMYKVFLKYPESLRPAFPRLKEKLEDPDPGLWVCIKLETCMASSLPGVCGNLRGVVRKELRGTSSWTPVLDPHRSLLTSWHHRIPGSHLFPCAGPVVPSPQAAWF